MNANDLALILCIFGPLSLLLISSHAYQRLKLPSVKQSQSLWAVFSLRALAAYLLYKGNLFFLYPLTWIYPLYLLRIYPQNDKWWGLSILCGMSSFFMPNDTWALALNILPCTVGPMYLNRVSNSRFVDSIYYNLCIGIYLLIYSSILWVPTEKIWLGASLELMWGIVFSVFLALKFMQEREIEYDISMDKFRRDKGNMIFTHSHLAELGLIARGMIHEVASTLTVLSAKIHFFKRHGPGEDFEEHLAVMERSVDRVRKILDGMRLFYQSDNNLYEDFNLKDMVSDVLLFCGQRFQNHGVSIRTYGLENIQMNSRRFQLEQAILQLMNNAFDAIEFLPEKWIEISAKKSANKVEIFIKDSGEGIPESIVRKMMDPFYSTKPEGKSTGTGLALTQGILQKNGGSLQYLKSRHTIFKVSIPLKPSLRLN